MSNHGRDYNRIVALLKSIAAPCQSDRKNAEHSWRNCRHCLAIEELEHADVRAQLQVFLLAVEIGDRHYGKGV